MSATNPSAGGHPTLERISALAMELPVEARTALVERLWDSLVPEMATDVEEAWELEIDRRLDEMQAGKASSIPAEEVFRLIRERHAE